jgi:hypothetical protein
VEKEAVVSKTVKYTQVYTEQQLIMRNKSNEANTECNSRVYDKKVLDVMFEKRSKESLEVTEREGRMEELETNRKRINHSETLYDDMTAMTAPCTASATPPQTRLAGCDHAIQFRTTCRHMLESAMAL